MKTRRLLETNEPAYLRRLVRELNKSGGFYAVVFGEVYRCSGARFHRGSLEVHSMFHDDWRCPESVKFWDGNGRYIVASREVRR